MKFLDWLFPPKKERKPLFPQSVEYVDSYIYRNNQFYVTFSDRKRVTFNVEKINPNNFDELDEDTLSWFFGNIVSAYPTGFIVTINKVIYAIKSDLEPIVMSGLVYTTSSTIRIK